MYRQIPIQSKDLVLMIKKQTCRLVFYFSIPDDHRLKRKEGEK